MEGIVSSAPCLLGISSFATISLITRSSHHCQLLSSKHRCLCSPPGCHSCRGVSRWRTDRLPPRRRLRRTRIIDERSPFFPPPLLVARTHKHARGHAGHTNTRVEELEGVRFPLLALYYGEERLQPGGGFYLRRRPENEQRQRAPA